MKAKIPSLTPAQVEISAEAAGGQLLSVSLRFRKGKVARTEEVAEMVFADYDRGGNLLALEFAEPESTGISLMGELARKLHIPQLRMFDVSRFPASVEENAVPA